MGVPVLKRWFAKVATATAHQRIKSEPGFVARREQAARAKRAALRKRRV